MLFTRKVRLSFRGILLLLETRLAGRASVLVFLIVLLTFAYAQYASAQATCPCSIWDGSATPTVDSENDAQAVEVGVKFRSDVDGTITGIRFYKGALNVGPHTGNLWDANEQLLATVNFTNETASGWQQADFSSPVSISANTTYVASYHTQSGFYSLDENYFAAGGVNNAPLRALEDGIDGGNGVYVYGQSAFPTQTFNTSNFWVDLVFEIGPDLSAPTVTGVSPQQGATVLALDTSVTVAFNEAMDPAGIDTTTFELRDAANNLVPATVSYDAPSQTATLDPVNSLGLSTFTATVLGGADPAVKDLAGNAMAADYAWSFTTSTCQAASNSIVCENAKPGNPASDWDITGAGDLSIQGFATEMSVDQGQTVRFKIRLGRHRLPVGHLPHGLLRRLGCASGGDGDAVGGAAAEPADLQAGHALDGNCAGVVRSRAAGDGISYAVTVESGVAPTGKPSVEVFDGTKTAKKPPANPPSRMRGRSMCPSAVRSKKERALPVLGR